MDSRLLHVLEEAFGDELAWIPDLGGLEEAVQATLRTLGRGLLQRVLDRQPQGYEGSRRACDCGERLVHAVGGRVLAEEDRRLSSFRHDREPPAAEAHPQRLYVTAGGTTVHERDGWHEVKVGRLYWEDERLERHDWTVGRFEDSERFGWHLWQAACRCGLREADEVVFLGDGAAWIRSEKERHFQRATFIVDNSQG